MNGKDNEIFNKVQGLQIPMASEGSFSSPEMNVESSANKTSSVPDNWSDTVELIPEHLPIPEEVKPEEVKPEEVKLEEVKLPELKTEATIEMEDLFDSGEPKRPNENLYKEAIQILETKYNYYADNSSLKYSRIYYTSIDPKLMGEIHFQINYTLELVNDMIRHKNKKDHVDEKDEIEFYKKIDQIIYALGYFIYETSQNYPGIRKTYKNYLNSIDTSNYRFTDLFVTGRVKPLKKKTEINHTSILEILFQNIRNISMEYKEQYKLPLMSDEEKKALWLPKKESIFKKKVNFVIDEYMYDLILVYLNNTYSSSDNKSSLVMTYMLISMIYQRLQQLIAKTKTTDVQIKIREYQKIHWRLLNIYACFAKTTTRDNIIIDLRAIYDLCSYTPSNIVENRIVKDSKNIFPIKVVEFGDRQDIPFGILSPSSLTFLSIEGQKYATITNFIYSKLLTTNKNKRIIKSTSITINRGKIARLMEEYDTRVKILERDDLVQKALRKTFEEAKNPEEKRYYENKRKQERKNYEVKITKENASLFHKFDSCMLEEIAYYFNEGLADFFREIEQNSNSPIKEFLLSTNNEILEYHDDDYISKNTNFVGISMMKLRKKFNTQNIVLSSISETEFRKRMVAIYFVRLELQNFIIHHYNDSDFDERYKRMYNDKTIEEIYENIDKDKMMNGLSEQQINLTVDAFIRDVKLTDIYPDIALYLKGKKLQEAILDSYRDRIIKEKTRFNDIFSDSKDSRVKDMLILKIYTQYILSMDPKYSDPNYDLNDISYEIFDVAPSDASIVALTKTVKELYEKGKLPEDVNISIKKISEENTLTEAEKKYMNKDTNEKSSSSSSSISEPDEIQQKFKDEEMKVVTDTNQDVSELLKHLSINRPKILNKYLIKIDIPENEPIIQEFISENSPTKEDIENILIKNKITDKKVKIQISIAPRDITKEWKENKFPSPIIHAYAFVLSKLYTEFEIFVDNKSKPAVLKRGSDLNNMVTLVSSYNTASIYERVLDKIYETTKKLASTYCLIAYKELLEQNPDAKEMLYLTQNYDIIWENKDDLILGDHNNIVGKTLIELRNNINYPIQNIKNLGNLENDRFIFEWMMSRFKDIYSTSVKFKMLLQANNVSATFDSTLVSYIFEQMFRPCVEASGKVSQQPLSDKFKKNALNIIRSQDNADESKNIEKMLNDKKKELETAKYFIVIKEAVNRPSDLLSINRAETTFDRYFKEGKITLSSYNYLKELLAYMKTKSEYNFDVIKFLDMKYNLKNSFPKLLDASTPIQARDIIKEWNTENLSRKEKLLTEIPERFYSGVDMVHIYENRYKYIDRIYNRLLTEISDLFYSGVDMDAFRQLREKIGRDHPQILEEQNPSIVKSYLRKNDAENYKSKYEKQFNNISYFTRIDRFDVIKFLEWKYKIESMYDSDKNIGVELEEKKMQFNINVQLLLEMRFITKQDSEKIENRMTKVIRDVNKSTFNPENLNIFIYSFIKEDITETYKQALNNLIYRLKSGNITKKEYKKEYSELNKVFGDQRVFNLTKERETKIKNIQKEIADLEKLQKENATALESSKIVIIDIIKDKLYNMLNYLVERSNSVSDISKFIVNSELWNSVKNKCKIDDEMKHIKLDHCAVSALTNVIQNTLVIKDKYRQNASLTENDIRFATSVILNTTVKFKEEKNNEDVYEALFEEKGDNALFEEKGDNALSKENEESENEWESVPINVESEGDDWEAVPVEVGQKDIPSEFDLPEQNPELEEVERSLSDITDEDNLSFASDFMDDEREARFGFGAPNKTEQAIASFLSKKFRIDQESPISLAKAFIYNVNIIMNSYLNDKIKNTRINFFADKYE